MPNPRTPKPKDAEVTAMQTIALVLAPLSQVEKERVVRWAYDRYLVPVGPPPAPYPGGTANM